MHRVWIPFALLAPPILGPVLGVLIGGHALSLFFEKLLLGSVLLYFASVAGWLAVDRIVPRIEPPAKPLKSLGVGATASIIMFVVAASLWLEAVDINVLRKNPVVHSVTELKAQYETPWGQRSRGIFVHGTLKPPSDPKSAQTLTYYSYRDSGASSSYFPLTLQLILPSGEEIEMGCIQQVVKAINWPEGGRAFSRGLKEGDTVIVWGDPSKLQAVGSGLESYGLQTPRALIYGKGGDLEALFLEPARRTARPVGWMALIVCLLAWLPMAFAFKAAQISKAP
jgi:hypothetical protein